MTPDAPFAGRGVLVTGGSRGIGRAVVLAFARAGADVAFSFRQDRRSADAVARAVEELGRRAVVRQSDSADLEAAAGWVDEAARELGRLDCVVTSAGGTGSIGWEVPRAEEWTGLFRTHVVGPYATVRAAAPHLRRTKGSAVLVASIAGLLAYPEEIAYATVKAGTISLARSLAFALAPEVRVNAIAPGWVRTDLTRALYDDPRARGAIERAIPRGRWGEPEDIAGGVLFLASDGARFITGETVAVDGGELLAWRIGLER